jgi:hypothetical protein
MRQGLLLLSLLITTATLSQSVKITSDPSIKTADYATFRVDKGDFITLSKDNEKADEAKFYRIMKESITRELINKGYTAVEDSTAQLIVSYVGESVQRIDTENLGPLGQQPASDATQVGASRNWSREYNHNSMVIEVTDFSTRKIIWRAQTTFEGTPLTDMRGVNAVIYRTFKKFPFNQKKKRK